jgi:hypothetical protein
MRQTTRRAPDTTAAREVLERALRLLDDPRPEALKEARAAARSAAEMVPFPWEQPYCRQYRKNMEADVNIQEVRGE